MASLALRSGSQVDRHGARARRCDRRAASGRRAVADLDGVGVDGDL